MSKNKEELRQRIVFKAAQRKARETVGDLIETLGDSDNATESLVDDTASKAEESVLKVLQEVSDAAQVYLNELLEDDADDASSFDEAILNDMTELIKGGGYNDREGDLGQNLRDTIGEKDVQDSKIKEAVDDILNQLSDLPVDKDSGVPSDSDIDSVTSAIASKLIEDEVRRIAAPLMVFDDKPLVGNVSDEDADEAFDPHLLTAWLKTDGQVSGEAADAFLKSLMGGNE